MTSVEDLTGVLSHSDAASIQALPSHLNFRILVTSATSKGDLDAAVGRSVNSSDTVAIGLDPGHHWVYTHFGVGTGIAVADRVPIERAGSPDFRAGHYADGIKAIMSSASAASSRVEHGSVVIKQETAIVDHGVPIWPFLVGFGALTVVIILVWRAVRRRQNDVIEAAEDVRDEARKAWKRGEEEQGWHDRFAAGAGKGAGVSPLRQSGPSVTPLEIPPGPASVPVIHIHQSAPIPVAPMMMPQPYYGGGGNNDFLTGMLVAEALEQPRVEREVVREVVREEPRYESRREDSSPALDTSSSSYDSGSSSCDSGGGGGDFGGGGGGSDGGGGGDSW